jgi:hypothetical protein
MENGVEYRFQLSHDSGAHQIEMLDGTLGKHFPRRNRVFHLKNGQWAVVVFSDAAIEVSPGEVLRFDYWSDRVDPRATELLERIADEEGLEEVLRDRAAIALGWIDSARGATALRSRIAAKPVIGSPERLELRLHLARLVGDPEAVTKVRIELHERDASELAVTAASWAAACVPELRGDFEAAINRIHADPDVNSHVSDLEFAQQHCAKPHAP